MRSTNFYFQLQNKMLKNKNLLYGLAVIIVTFWAIGFFIYSVGAIIHTLLIVAAVAVVLRVRKRKLTERNTTQIKNNN